MASELPVLRDDHGRKVVIGAPEPGTVTVNITCGMTSVLASFSGERLAIVREAIDRAAMPGQPLTAPVGPAYDPAIDNCANMPGCGDQRVLFTWFHSPAICCPRCYENLFGGTPEPGSVITIPAATPASGRADGEAPAAEARDA